MKKQLIIVFTLLVMMIAGKSYGQSFINAMDINKIDGLIGNACILTLRSGEEIRGSFRSVTSIFEVLSKITIKTDNGGIGKYKVEQIKSFWIKLPGLGENAMVPKLRFSVNQLSRNSFEEAFKCEYLIFESVEIYNKSNTFRLLQLLNSGFDNKIKVYALKTEEGQSYILNRESGRSNRTIFTGGDGNIYLFVKNGGEAVKVTKSEYGRIFNELYSDCPEMPFSRNDEDIEWNDVAGHVFVYDQICK